MEAEYLVGSTVHHVSVEPRGGRWRIILDGEEMAPVDATISAQGTLLFRNETRVHEAFVARVKDKVWVWIDGHALCLEPPPEVAAGADDSFLGRAEVLSPMPGTVVSIPVALGDAVQARQTVAVVEAMKMENALQSPIAGLITQIKAAPGDLVDGGAVLVVVEAEPADQDVSSSP